MPQPERKIDLLLVRMDRMGDLVLNLPVDQVHEVKEYYCHWLITSGLGFVCDLAQPQRSYTEHSLKFSLRGVLRLVRWLKQYSPQQAIVFHAPWWVGLALFLARVPKRGGRLSQWHSFLFYNQGLRQKRSLAQRHETEYNLELLLSCIQSSDPKKPESPTGGLEGQAPALNLFHPDGRAILREKGLSEKDYVVVHPGMGGSALNWPQKHYSRAIDKILAHRPVVITGTYQDRQYLKDLEERFSQHPKVHWLVGRLTSKELVAVLQGARAVLAPSTGVLHLAASTGSFSLGLYSNVLVESARRWGPRGPRAQVLEAPDGWSGPLAMEKITVQEVMAQLEGIL